RRGESWFNLANQQWNGRGPCDQIETRSRERCMAELALPCCANGCFMPCRRTGKAVSPLLLQAKEELFHLFTTRLGKSSAFADPRESAFFQDAQRANVVFSGTSVQRTYLAVL